MTSQPPKRDPELDHVNHEDLCLLKGLWSKAELTNSDIRNSSHIVRRLLVYRDIVKSAAPRGLRLTFNAPDNKPLIRAAENGLLEFFQSGGTTALGIWFRASTLHRGQAQYLDHYMRQFNPDRIIELKLDGFLKQSVFFFKGQFISRGEVIEYVANKAGGPHFDRERKGAHQCLDHIRSTVTMRLIDDVSSFGFNLNAIEQPGAELLPPSRDSIDPVFIELAATCRYLCESPSIQHLIELLENGVSLG